jgi:vitamin B12 transporter
MSRSFLSSLLATVVPLWLCASPSHAAEITNELIVTASRSGVAVPQRLLGSSVTVLDASALSERQTREVADILRDVPGLAVNVSPGLTQIRMRGTEANHTLVLVDGIEVSDPYYGEFDFGTLMADDGARIEVLRGQQSALYGSDAIGGVIHYISGSGRDAPGVSLRAETGSFGTLNGAARWAGLEQGLDYALTASVNSRDGTPNSRTGSRKLGKDALTTGFKLSYGLNDQLKLTAVGRYGTVKEDINNSDNDSSSRTFGYIIDSAGTYYRNTALYGLVRADWSGWEGRWTQALTLQVADTQRKGYSQDLRTSGDQGGREKGSYETSLLLGSGTTQDRLTFAVDAEREQFRNTDPSGYAFTGTRRLNNTGLVAMIDHTVGDRLAIGASIRRDLNDQFADATTYRVQGSYQALAETRLHAAMGSGIKNPGFYELFGYMDGRFIGNAALRPERSEGWEIGFEQTLFDRALVLDLTRFDSRLKDEIYTTYPAPTYVATPANRKSNSTQVGLELTAMARLASDWHLNGAYTWLKAREVGLEEVRRPANIGSLALSWRAPSQVGGLALVVRYNGPQTDLAYTDPSYEPVRARLKSYTLVNLNGDYALTPAIKLTARAENLLDQTYEELFSFRGRGRAAFVGISSRF